MQLKSIYLDMDGVLSDLRKAILKYHDHPDDPLYMTDYAIHTHMGMESDEVWNPVIGDQEFWESLEVLPWAADLLRVCRGYGETSIVTKAFYSEACIQGKLNWLSRHLGVKDFEVIFCRDKARIAHDDGLLIDDLEDTCDEFRANGGISLVFPAVHNSKADILLEGDPMDVVYSYFRHLTPLRR